LPGARDSDDEGEGVTDHADYISPNDAVEHVRDEGADTLAPENVERIIWDRIARCAVSVRPIDTLVG